MILALLLIPFVLSTETIRSGGCENPGELANFCENMKEWDRISQTVDVPTGRSCLPALATGEVLELKAVSPANLPATKYDCLNWKCVCTFLTGAYWNGSNCILPSPTGAYLSNVKRSEIKTLRTDQLTRYAKGFYAAYQDIYEYLAYVHSTPKESPGAHSGPAFLPWHRVFVKRMELSIRNVYVDGEYPFWDTTIPYWDNH